MSPKIVNSHYLRLSSIKLKFLNFISRELSESAVTFSLQKFCASNFLYSQKVFFDFYVVVLFSKQLTTVTSSIILSLRYQFILRWLTLTASRIKFLFYSDGLARKTNLSYTLFLVLLAFIFRLLL